MRLALLIPALALLFAGCGSSRSDDIIIADDAPEAASAGTTDEQASVAANEAPAADPAKPARPDVVDSSGVTVPSRIAISIIPGIGYQIEGKNANLAEIDELLRLMAKHNRYSDIQIRAKSRGTATLVQPLLDLTEKHDLVNVSLHTGR
ncbi:MAG: hypothetical protein PF961_23915 [Planctomycetota bacterium]|jgi:hypothetical protein|nr:hypothetical protein [Planctomycetota bacterium]